MVFAILQTSAFVVRLVFSIFVAMVGSVLLTFSDLIVGKLPFPMSSPPLVTIVIVVSNALVLRLALLTSLRLVGSFARAISVLIMRILVIARSFAILGSVAPDFKITPISSHEILFRLAFDIRLTVLGSPELATCLGIVERWNYGEIWNRQEFCIRDENCNCPEWSTSLGYCCCGVP